MIWDIQKFNSEIKALKRLFSESALHPLRKEQLKESVMSALSAQTPLPGEIFALPGRRLIKYLIAMLIGIGLVGGTALASQSSIPGNALYPIKRAVEKLQTGLSITANAKARVETKHAEERFLELAELELQEQAEVGVVAENGDDNSNAGDSQNPQATSTVVLKASSTLIQSSANNSSLTQKRNKVKLQARQDAKEQLGRAKDSLNRVKVKLEAKGDTKAVLEIEGTIEILEQKALEVGLKAEVKGELKKSENEPDKNGSVKVKLPLVPDGNNSQGLGSSSTTKVEIRLGR